MTNCPNCDEPHDYIPGGKSATRVSNVRQLGVSVRARCGAVVGHDIQSGPLYCGDRATLTADDESGDMVYVCKRHEPVLRALAT